MKYIFAAIVLFTFTTGGDYTHTYDPSDVEFYRLVMVESSFNPRALSKVGAIGLTQITTNCLAFYNWKEGKQIRPSELYNPRTNLIVCRWYRKWLREYFSHLSEPAQTIVISSAYNLGHKRVQFKSNQFLIYRRYVGRISPFKYTKFKHQNKLLWKGKNIDLWELVDSDVSGR